MDKMEEFTVGTQWPLWLWSTQWSPCVIGPASGLSVLDVYYIPEERGDYSSISNNNSSSSQHYSHPRSFRQYTFQEQNRQTPIFYHEGLTLNTKLSLSHVNYFSPEIKHYSLKLRDCLTKKCTVYWFKNYILRSRRSAPDQMFCIRCTQLGNNNIRCASLFVSR